MKKATKPLSSMSKKLRELREKNGLSMREAAIRIGVPVTTYREWEYGRTINGEPYPQIARVFGTSLQELFGEFTRSETSIEWELDRIIADLLKLKVEVQKIEK